MKVSSRIITLAVFACSLAPAQYPGTATAPTIAEIVTSQVARLTKLLTLTTAQASLAISTFTTEETALATIKTNLATAQTAMTTAVEANSTSGIVAAASQIGTLAQQQAQAEGTAEATFYASLTAAQQTIYKELLASGLTTTGPIDQGPHGRH